MSDLVQGGASQVSLDQRLRVAMAVIGSFLIALMQSLHSLLWVLLMVVALWVVAIARLSRWLPAVDVRAASRRSLRLNILTLMIILTLCWQIAPTGGVSWHPEGVHQAWVIALRLNAIALWCLLWLAHLSAESLASALRALGLPMRLALLFYLSLRSLEVLWLSRSRLQQAMRARAHAVRWSRRVQITAQMLVLIMVEGLRRADSLAAALRARGVDLRTGGFLLARASWRDVPQRDGLIAVALLVLLASLGWGVS
jgi:energy-coupling factor transporter transmembrane protein EcfT